MEYKAEVDDIEVILIKTYLEQKISFYHKILPLVNFITDFILFYLSFMRFIVLEFKNFV